MTNIRSLIGVFMLFVAAIVTGCGGGGDDTPPAAATSASAVIGPAGGTLTGPDGVQVVVPAGALSGNTTIGIARNAAGAPAPLQEGNAPAGSIYEFTPHDVVFNIPVTIRIPVSANAASSEVFMASLGGDWMVNSATLNGAYAEWQRNSFSFGLAGLACAPPIGDLYPCAYPSGGATVAATAGAAIAQIAPGWLNFGAGSAGSWRVTSPGTISVTLHYRAAPDCGAVGGGGLSGRVRLIRWNPAVPLNTPDRVTTVFDQTVALTQEQVIPPVGTMSHGGGPTFRGVGSTTVDVSAHLGAATNAFGFTFSCQRPGRPVHRGGDLITIIGPMAAPSGPYTIGGTVSGLTGAGLVLRNNGGDDEAVAANATGFTFNTAIAAGAAYAVTVQTQPAGQTCTVQNATATANTNVTNVAVSCQDTSVPAVTGPLSSMGGHTCAIKDDLTVACWGDNSNYALGDGTAIDRSFPVTVTGLVDVVEVSVGTTHSCARKSDGTVWCWGANDFGQIGVSGSGAFPAPTQVAGLTDVAALSAGRTHNCVLRTNGTVACWGRNHLGQLGDGTPADSDSPVEVAGLSGVSVLNAGWDRTCAVTAGGAVSCWGDIVYGLSPYVPTSAPVAVSGLTDAVSVSSGGNYHACALRANNSVACWGDNGDGQLGNGSNAPSLVAVTVTGLTDAAEVSTASGHSCAIRTNGSMACWGGNSRGQLGDDTTTNRNTPVAVTGLTGSATLATGGAFTCVLKTDGSAACWGYNLEGYLGDGSTVQKQSPSPVVGGAIFWM